MNVKFCDKTTTPITFCGAHSHKHWEIILHTGGHNVTVVEQTTYPLGAGDVLVIPPNTLHKNYSDTPYTDMYLQCEDAPFDGVVHTNDTDGSVRELFEMLLKLFTEKDGSYKAVTDSLCDTICVYVNKYAATVSKHAFVNELKNQMYLQLANSEFNVAAFIEQLGLNADYVRRCFKKETGQTPVGYLTQMRLNRAKGLLRQETYQSVVDVAEKCGFADSYYFSRLFKQHFGISPLNYRTSKTKG